ncbi:MAG: hypothetical protein SGI88_03385 [Candidatus Hydrogenedentes bacterium]|nr:hypothetical protein [Candidatus Hydrogenedentota bacterium]
MLNTIKAVMKDGKIELLEQIEIPEGSSILATVLADDEEEFWLKVSESSLGSIWDNNANDTYAELLDR